ncbi:DUF2849 domain-containing protein [Neomegalonema perideroedes]|uniref:DUF2849 domain-containing protein n=1 Tax=Neomegalonema perideroedes TaxID=217219 RepID=UPI000366AC8E|nr:DUF2849 domain-containing protein [Neomegalonema perideroedes]
MAKAFVSSILTANDLREGWSVFLTRDGRWSRDWADLRVAASAEEGAELSALGAAEEAARRVVGAYLVEIDAEGRAKLRRERIRAEGPTHRADLRRADALSEAA